MRAIRAAGQAGAHVVSTHKAETRPDDPETLAADQAAENAILGLLESSGVGGTFLSEEAGAVAMRPARPLRGAEQIYAACDPLDGSAFLRRGISAFQYVGICIYGSDLAPIAAVLGDLVADRISFADAQRIYERPRGEQDTTRAQPLVRGRCERIEDAYVAMYMMKPPYLYPGVQLLEPLLSRVSFFVPNGGPAGFWDVAAGRLDAYLSLGDPATEVLTAAPVAGWSGCILTDLEGGPLKLSPDLRMTYPFLCTATAALHEQMLQLIASLSLPRRRPPAST